MTAKQAKEITLKNRQGPMIQEALVHIFKQIQEAAGKGKSEIINPLSGRTPYEWHTSEFASAVYTELRRLGYEVIDNPDPDPGHPASHPYISVSWK